MLQHRRTAFGIWAALATAMINVSGTAAAAPSLRSQLYGVGSVDRFCTRAQQIVSSTALISYNIVHNDLTTFANSSAAPYDAANTGAFNGTLAWNANGNTMPVFTQQLVSSRELGTTGWEYPVVISCKMKTAEAINFHFGPANAGAQQSCREINQDTVARVYASLTSIERRTLKWQEADIVYTQDFYASSGPTFLYPLPYLPRVAAVLANGQLALVGRAIFVDRQDPTLAAGPDKKGSYYCHLPSPEYVRAMITGQTLPIIEAVPF